MDKILLLEELEGATRGHEIAQGLRWLAARFPGQVVFSTSFSIEDQVITDFIFRNKIGIDLFTLDTGRMFPETYSTWARTIEKYKGNITAYYPDALSLQEFIRERGPNSFYESVENRKHCCHIRKVEPLQRALKGRALWITGIRAEHSPDRHDMQQWEWDETNQVIKFHPLLHWSTDEVREYIRKREVPYNPLHDKGFVSIGCAPCTRAIRAGEDFRAGRWWWESSNNKECGLHVHETGGEKN